LRICFVGGLGFIGSRSVNILVEKGYKVTVLDIRKPKKKPKDFKFVYQDVRDFDSLLKTLKKEKPDAVYDFAGTTLNEDGGNPRYSVGLDVWGLSNVFEAAKRLKIDKVLYSSSFYVYEGISPSKTVDESFRSNQFVTGLLGSSKLAGERVVQSYSGEGVDFIIFRHGSAYGFDERCTSVPYFLLKEGIKSKNITIWGKGDRMNQYTYVDDIARGVVSALKYSNKMFNLISPERTSMRQLAKLMEKKFGFKATFDVKKRAGSSFPKMKSNKAINKLKWKTTTLSKGLEKTFEGFLK